MPTSPQRHLAFVPFLASVLGLVLAGRGVAAPLAYVSDAAGDSVSIIDTGLGKVHVRVPVGSNPTGNVVGPDGARLYVAIPGSPPSLIVIDAATNLAVATVPLTGASGDLSGGASMAASATHVYVNDGVALLVVDRSTNSVVNTIPLGCNPAGVDVSPDGTRVYVADCEGGAGCSGCAGRAQIDVVDTTTDAVLTSVPLGPAGGFISDVAVSPDGTRVFAANHCDAPKPPPPAVCATGALVALDTASNAITGTPVSIDATPNLLVVSPAGDRVYVAHFNNPAGTELPGSVTVVDVAASMVQTTIPVGRFPTGIDVTPDGSTVYVPSRDDGTVAVIDTATNTGTSIPVGGKPVAGKAFIAPEDTGLVPPDKPSLGCGAMVAKKTIKLLERIVKCHIKAARKARNGVAFDEEACEGIARAKFDGAVAAVPGCSPCVADNTPRLRDVLSAILDRANGEIYCAGSEPFAP